MGWVALGAAPFVEKCEAGELSYQKEPCHACADCPPEKSLETNISQMVFCSSPYLWSQAVAMPSELLESVPWYSTHCWHPEETQARAGGDVCLCQSVR